MRVDIAAEVEIDVIHRPGIRAALMHHEPLMMIADLVIVRGNRITIETTILVEIAESEEMHLIDHLIESRLESRIRIGDSTHSYIKISSMANYFSDKPQVS